jgi:predicted nucleic acid-binding protein
MAYLVDTDIIVDFTRGNQDAADYLDSLQNQWSISALTSLELVAGPATKAKSPTSTSWSPFIRPSRQPRRSPAAHTIF